MVLLRFHVPVPPSTTLLGVVFGPSQYCCCAFSSGIHANTTHATRRKGKRVVRVIKGALDYKDERCDCN